ncbi:MAG: hypothetical protein QW808_03295 [Desulfurococcaceae archaeon]
MTKNELLANPDCFATTALLAVVKKFGLDALYWLPHTLRISVEREFGELPESFYNKLFAAQTVVTSDFYYFKLEHFVVINNVFYNGDLDDLKLDPEELCWGIAETQLLFPHPIVDDPRLLFSSDIVELMDFVLRSHGITISPKILLLVGIQFNRLPTVLKDFADDPVMYEAITKEAIRKTRHIDIVILERLSMLTQQLIQLGLDTDFDGVRSLLVPAS